MKEIPTHVSESVRRRNPHLYPALGGLPACQPERTVTAPLENSVKKCSKRKGRVVACVTIIAVRHRLLDDDNAATAAKFIRDAIADTLGIDDGDPRIRWQYGQVETREQEGLIVKIESVK